MTGMFRNKKETAAIRRAQLRALESIFITGTFLYSANRSQLNKN